MKRSIHAFGLLVWLAVVGHAAGPLVSRLESVGFTVSDMDRSVRFFEEALSFDVTEDIEVSGDVFATLQGVPGARVVRMRLGGETLELTEYLTPQGLPIPPDSKSNDLWFQHVAIIVSDMDRAYAHLQEYGVPHTSPEPQTLPDWNPNAGGIRAFYFRDPDGHNLEILWFPPAKGAAKWHEPTEALFLGIDHTAIVVDDTEESLDFYRSALGMEKVGESENYGPEQERLNNVVGADLRITGLRAQGGPGVEFLEHLAPGGGRPFPADVRASDLVHWQTTFLTEDAEEALTLLRDSGVQFVSTLPDSDSGPAGGIMVRDPDGHAIRLLEP